MFYTSDQFEATNQERLPPRRCVEPNETHANLTWNVHLHGPFDRNSAWLADLGGPTPTVFYRWRSEVEPTLFHTCSIPRFANPGSMSWNAWIKERKQLESADPVLTHLHVSDMWEWLCAAQCRSYPKFEPWNWGRWTRFGAKYWSPSFMVRLGGQSKALDHETITPLLSPHSHKWITAQFVLGIFFHTCEGIVAPTCPQSVAFKSLRQTDYIITSCTLYLHLFLRHPIPARHPLPRPSSRLANAAYSQPPHAVHFRFTSSHWFRMELQVFSWERSFRLSPCAQESL